MIKKYTKRNIEAIDKQIAITKEFLDNLSKLNTDKISDFKQALISLLDKVIEGQKLTIQNILNEDIESAESAIAKLKFCEGARRMASDLKQQLLSVDETIATVTAELVELKKKKEKMLEELPEYEEV